MITLSSKIWRNFMSIIDAKLFTFNKKCRSLHLTTSDVILLYGTDMTGQIYIRLKLAQEQLEAALLFFIEKQS